MADASGASLLALAGGPIVHSYKYMIRSIQLCEDITISGTGFSNLKNCAPLFEQKIPAEVSDSREPSTIALLEDVQDGKYAAYQIDLMSPSSRAKLNVASNVEAGSYNYAIINWASQIAFSAEIPSINDPSIIIYSKPATSLVDYIAGTTHSMLSGPAEETAYPSHNGGTFFKLPRPFVISDEDVENKTEFVIDMVFNPENTITSTDVPSDFSMNSRLEATDGAMYMPMLSLAPVPRKATDTNTKELYEITDDNGASYRVEIYYNTSDADKNILGLSVIKTSSSMTDDAKIIGIAYDTDGKITATGASGHVVSGIFLSDFVRGNNCTGKIHEVNIDSCIMSASVVQ